MISISKRCVDAILEHTKLNLPYESCGVIASQLDHPNLLTTFYPISNSHPYPRHQFLFDAQEWINVNYIIREQQQFISCYVHSHIQTSPQLSIDDIENIQDADALQMVVHYIEKNSPTLHLYRFNKRTSMYEDCSLMFT